MMRRGIAQALNNMPGITALVDSTVAVELIPVTAIPSERAKGREGMIEIYKIRAAETDD